jgi:hypothetical protein
MSHTPMNLEIETLSSLGHDSIGMNAQHWSYHSCWVDISYLAWISFSKGDLLLCDATNMMQCCAKWESKHEWMLYDKQNALRKLNLSCQVWTLVKFPHDEPNYMPWAKQGTTSSCKTHVHHYLDKVRQVPSKCTYEMLLYDKANYMTLEVSVSRTAD